jgi:hypothetical protein
MTPTESRLVRKPLRFERNFTQIPNTWVRDERISYKARGIRDMLMSHKTGFEITLKSLAAASPREGIDSVRAGVEELEVNGYLIRTMQRGRHVVGTVTTWELCDPFDDGQTALDKPTSTSRRVGSSNAVALDDPTPVRTPVKNTNYAPSNVTPVAREAEAVASKANIDGFADTLPAEPSVSFVPCPARPVAPCALDLNGICIDIRRHPKQGAHA